MFPDCVVWGPSSSPWQGTCPHVRRRPKTFNNIFHADALHFGGICVECQHRLFFPFAPISLCDGRNYSPPWQISIGSIREEQRMWSWRCQLALWSVLNIFNSTPLCVCVCVLPHLDIKFREILVFPWEQALPFHRHFIKGILWKEFHEIKNRDFT